MVDYGCCARMCARLFLWFDYLSGSIIISLVSSSGCCSVRRRAGNAGERGVIVVRVNVARVLLVLSLISSRLLVVA
jgi:hypothetical protein